MSGAAVAVSIASLFHGLSSYAPKKPIKLRITTIEHMGKHGTTFEMPLDHGLCSSCTLFANLSLGNLVTLSGGGVPCSAPSVPAVSSGSSSSTLGSAIASKGDYKRGQQQHLTSTLTSSAAVPSMASVLENKGEWKRSTSSSPRLYNFVITTDNEFVVAPVVNDAEIGSCHYFLTRSDDTRVYVAGQFLLDNGLRRVTWNSRSGSYTRFLFSSDPKTKDKTLHATSKFFKQQAKAIGFSSKATSDTISMHASPCTLEYLTRELPDAFKSTLRWRSAKAGNTDKFKSVFKLSSSSSIKHRKHDHNTRFSTPQWELKGKFVEYASRDSRSSHRHH
jgi:hypothetical protein